MNTDNTAQTRTFLALTNALGLDPNFCREALERQIKPIPRNRKHYKFYDATGSQHFPDKTIDEAIYICEKNGLVEIDESELRKGIRMKDGSYLKDVYDSGILEHEAKEV